MISSRGGKNSQGTTTPGLHPTPHPKPGVVESLLRASYFYALNLSLCVCLFPHKIGGLQGIGSRHCMPVEGLAGMFLEGCRSTSCLATEERDSLVRSPRVHMPF